MNTQPDACQNPAATHPLSSLLIRKKKREGNIRQIENLGAHYFDVPDIQHRARTRPARLRGGCLFARSSLTIAESCLTPTTAKEQPHHRKSKHPKQLGVTPRTTPIDPTLTQLLFQNGALIYSYTQYLTIANRNYILLQDIKR